MPSLCRAPLVQAALTISTLILIGVLWLAPGGGRSAAVASAAPAAAAAGQHGKHLLIDHGRQAQQQQQRASLRRAPARPAKAGDKAAASPRGRSAAAGELQQERAAPSTLLAHEFHAAPLFRYTFTNVRLSRNKLTVFLPPGARLWVAAALRGALRCRASAAARPPRAAVCMRRGPPPCGAVGAGRRRQPHAPRGAHHAADPGRGGAGQPLVSRQTGAGAAPLGALRLHC